jgi:hypothetical protein
MKINDAKGIRLAAGCMCLFMTGICTSAHAAFIIQGGSTQNLPIAGNAFNTELMARGLSQMTAGGQLRVSQDGFIDYYYIGAESLFNNTFMAQGNALSGNNKGFLTEHDEGFDFSGYAGFTIAVSANDVLDFRFTSDNGAALTPVDNFNSTNLEGLGIYFDPSQSGSLQQVVLGYDDQSMNDVYDDNDFEDMLIRADFRPNAVVPVPAAAWLFASGLVGLVGVFRRKNTDCLERRYPGSGANAWKEAAPDNL